MAKEYTWLAGLRPSSTSETEFYVVPSSTQIIANLAICNQDSSPRIFSVARTQSSGSAAGKDWIFYNQLIPGNTTMNYSGICMKAAETLRVQAEVADKLSFNLDGCKIT